VQREEPKEMTYKIVRLLICEINIINYYEQIGAAFSEKEYFNLSPQHDDITENGGVAPVNLKVNTRRRLLVSCRSRPQEPPVYFEDGRPSAGLVTL
jgi:hypothetical protein